MEEQGTHEAGTIPECAHCVAVAYEPGWYAMLQRLSQRLEDDSSLLAPPPPVATFAAPVPTFA